jgi:hypothetical protein
VRISRARKIEITSDTRDDREIVRARSVWPSLE